MPCLLRFDGVDECSDPSGDTKYFLRRSDGRLEVLPGLEDPKPATHDCTVFNTADGSRELCSEFGALHGTGVAGMAAAYPANLMLRNNNGGMSETAFRGVAYGAWILVYARPLIIAGLPSSFEQHAACFRNAPKEADVYNFSHTFGTPVTNIDSTFRNAIHGSGFTDIAEAIRDNGEGKPLVAAADNHGEAFPRFPAALLAFFPNLRGRILAVTATDDSGGIASYANRCGRLPSNWNRNTHGRHYCLAAPGGVRSDPFWTTGPDNNAFYTTTGTSFASPVVAGAFAILMERFREQLNGEQIVLRLVNTADEKEPYDDVAVYGADLLDIENAITPVGNERMSVADDIGGEITCDFDITSLSTSVAFGDALQRAFQSHEVAASKKFKVSPPTISYRLKSPNYPDYVSADIPKEPPKPIKYRYTVNGKKYRSLQEIGYVEGLTKERIRQKMNSPKYPSYRRF